MERLNRRDWLGLAAASAGTLLLPGCGTPTAGRAATAAVTPKAPVVPESAGGPWSIDWRFGDVQVTKDAGLLAKQADNPFYRTLYGQKYLYLRRQVGMGALSV